MPMSRRHEVLDLLSKLEREKLGQMARQRGVIEQRLSQANAERGRLVRSRLDAREAPAVEALGHLAAFDKRMVARITRCEQDADALRIEHRAAGDEISESWRRSKALQMVSRRSS